MRAISIQLVTILVTILLISLTGCLRNYVSVPDKSQTQPLSVFRRPMPDKLEPYVLEPGDEVEVKFFYYPDLNDRVKIRPDGKISLMLLDDVMAAGLTPAKLDENLTRGYEEKLNNVDLTVIVREFTKRNVYVDGEVQNPSAFALNQKINVRQAIAATGGVTHAADLRKVVLIRRVDENNVAVVTLDLSDMKQKDEANVFLKPFDIVYVPPSGIGKANQVVRQYLSNMIPDFVRLNFVKSVDDVSRSTSVTISP
jgi:protein involved in polysaccharide export with SLBB domain